MMKFILLTLVAMSSMFCKAQVNYKFINVGKVGLKEEPITLKPGDTIIRDYFFADSLFVNKVNHFGIGFSDSTLTNAEIRVFNGSMTVMKPDGTSYLAYHAEGSLQWVTLWDINAKPGITDLRGCTCRVVLDCKQNKRTTVITRIVFHYGF